MTQAELVSWAQGVLAAEVSSPLNDVAGAVLDLVSRSRLDEEWTRNAMHREHVMREQRDDRTKRLEAAEAKLAEARAATLTCPRCQRPVPCTIRGEDGQHACEGCVLRPKLAEVAQDR